MVSPLGQKTMSDPESRILSAAVTDRGLSQKRPQNEDSYLSMGQCGIYAVADGVGGAQAGDVASQMAMEILGEAFANFKAGSDAETVMHAALERANGAIFQMAQELPQLSSMATTIVALHLADSIATIGHVGDSRLYRVDREGNLYRETADHSMVADEVRAGRMTEEQAENHPGRNIINRALGAEATVDVDMKTIMVEPGTSFLLCSDGITRHVGDQEIRGVLSSGDDPEVTCTYLKNLVYARGAEDNLTAVVVKVASPAESPHDTEQLIPDDDEPTIATPRPGADDNRHDDEDELLELDTRQLQRTAASSETSGSESSEPVPASLPLEAGATAAVAAENQSMETGSEPAASVEATGDANAARRFGFAVLWLLIGSIVGIGFYYFLLAPKPVDTGSPKLSEMRAANIPLSAFEENRRYVDKDPSAYIARYSSSPQDCEDYYLVGRAYLLTGDFIKARTAFAESRNRLSEADPTNSNILASDIAIGMSVTNDTTIQTILKKEFEASKSMASRANTSGNR
jgi:PPM family protein phosphatase